MLALLLAPQFVVAINNPLMWQSLDSNTGPAAAVAVSGYVGITHHQALRVNYATYEVDNPSAVLSGLTGSGDGACAYEVGGHSDDIGVGWMYFAGERWRGPSVELGAVRKSLHLSHCYNDAAGDEYETTTHSRSTAYVARAMGAWSWLFSDHIFASVGAGFSIGREAGTTTETGAHFHQLAAYPEMYFRLGFAFM